MGFLSGKTLVLTGGRAVLSDGSALKIQEVYPEAFEKNVHTTPTGHFENPELDIGRACVALTYPNFKYMTGETITLGGGLGLKP